MRMAAMAAVLIGLTGCATADGGEIVQTEVEVTMNCRVAEEGVVEDCRVTRERPGGYGMAAEAILAAERG